MLESVYLFFLLYKKTEIIKWLSTDVVVQINVLSEPNY